MSKTPLTLETLPRDAIVNILHFFDKFDDLRTLTSASPVCYRLSKAYSASTYKQSFINMHGPKAWETAATVLTYQRNTVPDRASTPLARTVIKRDLARPFVLQAGDIPQLIKNQFFFESCSKDYMTGDYPRAQSASIFRNTVVCQSHGLFATNDLFAPEPFVFTTGPTFPVELFYRVWLMSFQYSYSSINQLCLLPPLANKFEDFRLMCHIMSQNNLACRFGCMPSRQYYGVLEDCRPNGFFTTSVCSRAARTSAERSPGVYEINPPLFMKMVGLLRAGVVGDVGFWIKWMVFMRDYWVMGVEGLCEEYELDRFKE